MLKRTRLRSASGKQRARQAHLATLKLALLPRCGFRCEYPICRKKVRLDLAHVTSRAHGAPAAVDTVDNLLCLCRPHHDMVDRTKELQVEARGGEFFEFTQRILDGRSVRVYHHLTYQRPA